MIEEENTPDRQLRDIKLTIFSNNKEVNWVIHSGVINNFNEEGYLELAPLEIEALNPGSQEKLYFISAVEATYYTSSGIMEIQGPVNLEKDELELQADFLRLKSAGSYFTGQGNVEYSSPSFQITGQGFEADLELGIISFWGSGNQQAYLTWE